MKMLNSRCIIFEINMPLRLVGYRSYCTKLLANAKSMKGEFSRCKPPLRPHARRRQTRDPLAWSLELATRARTAARLAEITFCTSRRKTRSSRFLPHAKRCQGCAQNRPFIFRRANQRRNARPARHPRRPIHPCGNWCVSYVANHHLFTIKEIHEFPYCDTHCLGIIDDYLIKNPLQL
jgi:hypothetical protein